MGHKWWCRALVVSMAAFALVLGGCGSEDKVGTVDFGRIAQESARRQSKLPKYSGETGGDYRPSVGSGTKSKRGRICRDGTKKHGVKCRFFQMGKKQQFEALVESQAALLAKDKKLSIIMHKDAVHYQGTDVIEDHSPA